MSRRSRWVFGTMGLAGAGTVCYLIFNGNLSFHSHPHLGGAVNDGLSSQGFGSSGERIRLRRDGSSGLDLGNLDSVTGLRSPELSARVPLNALGAEIPDSFDSLVSSSSVRNIFSEISREGTVSELDREILKTYEQMLRGQRLQEHVTNFQSARKKVQDWVNKGGLEAKEDKDKSSEELKLTAGERTAIRDFYYIYTYLTQKSQHFHSRLYDAGKDSAAELSDTLTTKKAPELREVQKSLNDMQWDRETTKVQVKYLSSTGTLLPPKPDKRNSYGWTSWQRNPYRHFFSEEEFQKVMEGADRSQQALEEYVAGKRGLALFAFTFGVSPSAVYGDLSRFQKGIVGAESTAEHQVARRLLEWMGKLSTGEKK